MLRIVGILEKDGNNGRLVPEGKVHDIEALTIPQNYLNGAPFGMKVLVELISSPDSPQPLAKVVEVLGDPARPDVAMESIMLTYGLEQNFPKKVEKELESIPKELTAEDIQRELNIGRRDLRKLKTLTIDGVGAKDLDDAISIQKDQDGSYKLYVHIADVANYVKEDTALDKEALRRGNSVYLADRVVPMLPAKLSNGICSLNPGQDRLAMTCMMTYTSDGTRIDGDIFESIISSDLRADYDNVMRALEDNQVKNYESFMPELHWMRELAETLSKKAKARGALEFDFPETEVEMGKDGEVLDIHARKTSFADEIIEQFMIEANNFVAEKFRQLNFPFIYRVHDRPDEEKLEKFANVLDFVTGKVIKIPDKPSPKDITKILQEVKGLPAEKILENLLLRSLAKAIYSDEEIGHFGLALENYAHFTAPIRRYSDVFIHRVIKGFLRQNMNLKKWRSKVVDVAEHVSDTERLAVMAERSSVDQKVAEYYAERLGETYEAEITGFVGAGMFVMLPTTAEGMVPFRTMDDYYVYDELTMTAQGRDKHRLFMLGDKVRVQIVRADVVKRQIDLVLVDEAGSGRVDKNFANKLQQRKSMGHRNKRSKRSKKNNSRTNKNHKNNKHSNNKNAKGSRKRKRKGKRKNQGKRKSKKNK